MNNATLIAFASRGGVTEEYASIIADVLQQEYEFNVDVVKIGNNSIDVTPYNYVIVGSGVRTFRMHSGYATVGQSYFVASIPSSKTLKYLRAGSAAGP